MLVFFFSTFCIQKRCRGFALPGLEREMGSVFQNLVELPRVCSLLSWPRQVCQVQLCAGNMELQRALVLPHLSALICFLVTPPLSGAAVAPFWMAFEAEAWGLATRGMTGTQSQCPCPHPVAGPAVWFDGQSMGES